MVTGGENPKDQEGLGDFENQGARLQLLEALECNIVSGSEHFTNRGLADPRISLDRINIAAQMRRYFDKDKLYGLAQSIAISGLLQPIYVARMSEDDARAYVAFTNATWKRKASFDNFKPIDPNANERDYYVLIAGERRVRAMRKIRNYVDGSKAPDAILLDVHDTEAFGPLIAIQASENLHEPPESYDFYTAVYTLYKSGNYPSIAKFIAKHGRTVGESRARDAMLFFEVLPASVRNMVEQGFLPVTTGVELARFQKEYAELLLSKSKDELIARCASERGVPPEEVRIPGKKLKKLQKQVQMLATVNVTSKAWIVRRESWSSASVASNRTRWLEELEYSTPEFWESRTIPNETEVQRQRNLIAKHIRDISNSASRITIAQTQALTGLMGLVTAGEWPSYQPRLAKNYLRQLRSLRGLIETLTHEYEKDPEIRELGRFVVQMLRDLPEDAHYQGQ